MQSRPTLPQVLVLLEGASLFICLRELARVEDKYIVVQALLTMEVASNHRHTWSPDDTTKNTVLSMTGSSTSYVQSPYYCILTETLSHYALGLMCINLHGYIPRVSWFKIGPREFCICLHVHVSQMHSSAFISICVSHYIWIKLNMSVRGNFELLSLTKYLNFLTL